MSRYPEQVQADLMRQGIGRSAEQIRDILAERDALAAQVAACVELLGDVWRQWAIPDNGGKLWAGGLSTLEDVEDMLADIPASGRALLAERDELRARLIDLDMAVNAQRQRAERAETALRAAIRPRTFPADCERRCQFEMDCNGDCKTEQPSCSAVALTADLFEAQREADRLAEALRHIADEMPGRSATRTARSKPHTRWPCTPATCSPAKATSRDRRCRVIVVSVRHRQTTHNREEGAA